MIFAKWMRRFSTDKNKPIVLTVTGGMGAQIISAAIYFLLKNEGRAVYADLSYFDRAENIAAVGKPGEVSHWAWQLEPFGLQYDSFDAAQEPFKRSVELIEDGLKKATLGIKALKNNEVQKHFAIAMGIEDILPPEFSSGYLCIHVRRGDYLNVASHLIQDNEFIELADKFSDLAKYLVVVSDSPIDDSFRMAVSSSYKRSVFMDNVEAFVAHRIMRNARILICSNSQFSLVAALLNPRALVLLPKQWFGQKERILETPINETCSFQILNSSYL
jgi:hypothetical protein